MSKLAEVQTDFQEYLIDIKNKSSALSHIISDHLSNEKRAQIYFNAYRIRLKEILQQDFPKTDTLLGEDLFIKAFILYLDAHPSRHFNVRYFGQHFAHFLQETKPFSDDPIFSEMADFEWRLMGTLDAKDSDALTPGQLSAVPAEKWPQLRFSLHPSVSLTSYEWDTPQLWKLIDNEEHPRAPTKLNAPQHWLIWRKDLCSRYESISPVQAEYLQWLADSNPFSKVLENLQGHMPEEKVVEFAVSHLQYWMEQQVIAQFEVSSETN